MLKRRSSCLGCLTLGLSLTLTTMARGAGPAEPLFRLVPPDAGVTLALEDLRGSAHTFFESPLAQALERLPAYRTWRASGRFQKFARAIGGIEKVLGEKVATLRDDLLGDAVVLTLRVPPGGRPNEARGMLLSRVRNRALLDRLLARIIEAQQRSGEVVRVAERRRGELSYRVKEYRPESKKPPEYYTTLADNTFAWSNSEELIQGVLDRTQGTQQGLGDDPKFRKVRRRLPDPSVASLFVNPRSLTAVMTAAPRSRKPGEVQLANLIGRYLGAAEFLGAALEWREGPILHTEETLDPEALDPWIRRWAARPSSTTAPRAVPATALAMASANVDFEATFQMIKELTPPTDRPKLDTLLVALQGVLLGHDALSVLARLGPGFLGYVEPPASARPDATLPKVFVVNLGIDQSDSVLSAALDNGLRTLLAFYSLDAKHGGGIHHVEARVIDGTRVTSLDEASPFAYAIARGRLVLGNTAEAVAGHLAAGDEPHARFERLRATYFPKAETFACADLVAISKLADGRRAAIARTLAAQHHRKEEDEARDLDHVLALMSLFRDAFFTSTIAPDATSVHRMLGLIARDVSAK